MKETVVEKIVDVWDDYSVGVAILATVGIVIGAIALTFGVMCLPVSYTHLTLPTKA